MSLLADHTGAFDDAIHAVIGQAMFSPLLNPECCQLGGFGMFEEFLAWYCHSPPLFRL